jgi:hypothetical protein
VKRRFLKIMKKNKRNFNNVEMKKKCLENSQKFYDQNFFDKNKYYNKQKESIDLKIFKR